VLLQRWSGNTNWWIVGIVTQAAVSIFAGIKTVIFVSPSTPPCRQTTFRDRSGQSSPINADNILCQGQKNLASKK
jgi:hypothetical protein